MFLVCFCLHQSNAAVEEWVRPYNSRSDSDDQGTAITTDSAGNVIVAGYTDDGINGRDILVIKYSGEGLPLWTNRYDGPAHSTDQATAVGADANGNVFVAGYSAGSVSYSADYGHEDGD